MAAPSDLRDIFFIEAEELLTALEAGLRALQSSGPEPEVINAVFRAVHSIKGGAGAFGLTALVTFAHRFETVLDDLRGGKLLPEPDLVAALLVASDHLADMVTADREGRSTDVVAMERAIEALDFVVEAMIPEGAAVVEAEEDFTFEPLAFDGGFALPDLSGDRRWHIRFRPHAGAFASGHEPGLLLRDLCALGKAAVTLDTSILPLAGFDPGQSYLGWSVTLETAQTQADIEAVFEFIQSDCSIEVMELDATAAAPLPTAPVSVAIPATVAPPQPVPSAPKAAPAALPPAANTAGPSAAATAAAAPRPTIRVDIDRVDRLVDLLGELVIHQAMLTEAIENLPDRASADVDRSLDHLRQLSRQIQESVMAIRAQPVKPLFDRLHRIVREATTAVGKSARLVTEGETTEVDKTIIERLADPLTHMIRNSIDHGIEKIEARRAAGKPEEGVIRLTAAHRSGRIILTLQDDGAGIDRDRVRQVAIDKGLIPPTADLSPQEIDALLFMPGFSTAPQVSALSGRGVGMDVVRSEIVGLGGRVSIASIRGEGTTLTISLPLTLAVLDGMVVEVGGQTLVLPVSSIIETLRPDSSSRHLIGQNDSILEVRGRCLPLIDVGMALGFRGQPTGDEGSIIVVVERGDDSAVALMVDAIRDQRQVVIKGLEANYGQVPGIAAATVLGDGSVALILDPGDLAGVQIPMARLALPLAAE